MFKQYFSNHSKRLQQLTAILVVLMVAVAGTYLLTSSHAAAPYTSVTAANGTLANGAAAQSCSGTSASRCVVFAGSAATRYWGVQVFPNANIVQDLNAAQQLGANVIRVPFNWRSVEFSAKGQYDATQLAAIDAVVSGAASRNMKVIATIATTPTWASAGGLWNDAPTNAADYGNFAQFIANRYGAQLAAIEVWNEPEINNNLIPATGTTLAAGYTAMVKAAYQGVKAADPTVAVLAGALSYADVPFLNSLYAAGMKGSYDGISIHPYADGADPANMTVTHSFEGGIQTLHGAQQTAGDNTPLWVTEFGWPTGTSTGANTEQQQAAYIPEAFNILYGLPYVKGGILYQLRDQATDPTNPEDNFGILLQNYTQRAAYTPTQAALLAAPHS